MSGFLGDLFGSGQKTDRKESCRALRTQQRPELRAADRAEARNRSVELLQPATLGESFGFGVGHGPPDQRYARHSGRSEASTSGERHG